LRRRWVKEYRLTLVTRRVRKDAIRHPGRWNGIPARREKVPIKNQSAGLSFLVAIILVMTVTQNYLFYQSQIIFFFLIFLTSTQSQLKLVSSCRQ